MNNLKIDPNKNTTVSAEKKAEKHLKNGNIYLIIMSITGIGGGILAIVGILLLFSYQTIGLWCLGIGIVNMIFVSRIFNELFYASLNKAMEEINLSLKDSLAKSEKRIAEKKQRFVDSLPKN